MESCDLAGSREDVLQLLRLDPLTLLRCLRVAGSCFVGLDRSVHTVAGLVDELGRSFVKRAFRIETCAPTSWREHHALWLHALATAIAARELAEQSGTLDPEAAYLRGLLRRLHRWTQLLGDRSTDVLDTIERWNLPRILRDDQTDENTPEVRAIFEAAETLADLADFPPPGGDAPAIAIARDEMLAAVSKDSLVKARELRHAVLRNLESFGLELAYPVASSIDVEASGHLFGGEATGRQTDFIASLLMCRQSSSYRSIVTVATSAALRYLDFDRATFVSWHRERQSCFVKAKADFTIRRLDPRACAVAPFEADAMREALASERPQRLLRAEHDRDPGLLQLLGADEALLIQVNREFELPTFLVLDRTLSGRGIEMELDSTACAALGGTVAILTDNLRLRLDRIRAQKFAVTDPLTRLNNRTVGLMALEREMMRARREGLPLSVLMLDLDEFKDLNDTHGHLVGDQALRVTANVLRRTLRRSDVLCRYGGEEFLVVLPATAPDEASILAARLFVEVETAGDELRLPLTVSIGLACLRDSDLTTDDLVGRADRALYASKTRGRNRFSVDIS